MSFHLPSDSTVGEVIINEFTLILSLLLCKKRSPVACGSSLLRLHVPVHANIIWYFAQCGMDLNFFRLVSVSC